jgi:hypothetical protein
MNYEVMEHPSEVNVERMCSKNNTYRNLVGKPQGKMGKRRCILSAIDLRIMEWNIMDSIDMVENRNQLKVVTSH